MEKDMEHSDYASDYAGNYASDYAEKNRAAWNEVAPIHRRQRKIDLYEAVKDPAFSVLGDVEKRVLSEIGIQGMQIAHLCCNNGIELISMLRMNAGNGVGFDISDAFIEEARELAGLAGVNCVFVRTDVLEIPDTYNNQFDVVVFTIGALGWIADLRRLFEVSRRLLKTGGHLFVYEMHPFLDMLAVPGETQYAPYDELKIVYPYFSSKPWVDTDGLDYIGGTTYRGKEAISFPHTLSEILGALIENGFVITEYREYSHDISAAFAYLEKYQKIPLCYSLVAEKRGYSTDEHR